MCRRPGPLSAEKVNKGRGGLSEAAQMIARARECAGDVGTFLLVPLSIESAGGPVASRNQGMNLAER